MAVEISCCRRCCHGYVVLSTLATSSAWSLLGSLSLSPSSPPLALTLHVSHPPHVNCTLLPFRSRLCDVLLGGLWLEGENPWPFLPPMVGCFSLSRSKKHLMAFSPCWLFPTPGTNGVSNNPDVAHVVTTPMSEHVALGPLYERVAVSRAAMLISHACATSLLLRLPSEHLRIPVQSKIATIPSTLRIHSNGCC